MKKFKMIFVAFCMGLIACKGVEKPQEIDRVPPWAKEAVWYQIFPERFANGDRSNDPKPEDMEGAWPYFIPEGWQVHPWTSDWYKLQPWETKTGKDFYWNAGLRRYGGDLQGVMNKLDYLQDFGITAIYFNPLFEAPSLHKYDAAMYHHIDNNFGPDPKGDRKIWEQENPSDPSTWQWTSADKLFLELIEECHKRGMKIIIDGVFNHTGTTFWNFKDIVENQQNSKYKNWFTIKSWDDPKTEKNEFDYEGWLGVKDLPEIREDANGLVAGPREHVHAIVQRWMDPNGDGNPNDGIDGWRLDVAEMVNHNFWKEFRTWVKGINPNAYIVGEIWWEDWPNYKMMNASPWLQGDQFDAVMNYRFVRALKNFVLNTKESKESIEPKGFVDSLNTLLKDYPAENYYVMMNVMGSHDTERLASMLVNPDIWYDHNGNPAQNPKFDVSKPTNQARLKQKLMTGIQFTMPGAPHIYYGDEAGMWGGDDPDCRKPMVWKELNYDTETSHPFGKKRPADEVKFDKEIFDWYKLLAAVRKQNKELSLGDTEFHIVDEEKEILSYKREYEGSKIIVVINNNSKINNIDLSKEGFIRTKGELTELITREKIEFYNGTFNLTLKPYQILILK